MPKIVYEDDKFLVEEWPDGRFVYKFKPILELYLEPSPGLSVLPYEPLKFVCQ